MPKPKLEYRPKPPAPTPEEVERFISQGSERSSVQTPETPNVQTLKTSSIETPESIDVQTLKPLDAQTAEDSDVQTLNLSDTQTSENPDVQTLRIPDTQAPERLHVQPKKKKQTELKGPGLVQRQSGVVRRRMTIYLSPELAQSLQISSVHEGRELSEIISDALTKYLSRSQASRRSDV